MPSVQRSSGALSFPLPAPTAGDFASLDPARDILLELLAAAINAELAANWAGVVSGTLGGTNPVQSRHPFEPDAEALTQFKAEWPALFVYRDSDTPIRWEEHTLWQRKLTCRWGVDYFLGPLAIGPRGQLQDALAAVGKIVSAVIDAGGHRAYATTTTPVVPLSLVTQSHQKFVLGPWGAGTCGFSSVNVVDFNLGPAQFTADGPKYWACSLTLETVELDAIVPTGTEANFAGVTTTFGTGSIDGIIEDLVTADTDDA